MKKTLQIMNIAALVITVVINYLANTGIFNGVTMSEVSARYHNHFTPAGYAFSIWSLIYLGLFAFVFYQGRSLFKQVENDKTTLHVGWWFIISCIANCFWIIFWLYDFTGVSVFILAILLFSLIKIILNTGMELSDVSFKEIAFVWWPFSLYSGWVTVALIANVAAYLTKINWKGFGISYISWTVIMICIAGGINLLITWNRNMREFALAGAWGLIAIAVSNWNQSQTVVLTAIIMSVILGVNSGIHAFTSKASAGYQQ